MAIHSQMESVSTDDCYFSEGPAVSHQPTVRRKEPEEYKENFQKAIQSENLISHKFSASVQYIVDDSAKLTDNEIDTMDNHGQVIDNLCHDSIYSADDFLHDDSTVDDPPANISTAVEPTTSDGVHNNCCRACYNKLNRKLNYILQLLESKSFTYHFFRFLSKIFK